MITLCNLIAAHRRGDPESLKALAVALAAGVDPVADLPTDPAALYAAVEDRGVQPGTWQEVAAARDTGDLTAAEYDYLAAAVDALTLEEE